MNAPLPLFLQTAAAAGDGAAALADRVPADRLALALWAGGACAWTWRTEDDRLSLPPPLAPPQGPAGAAGSLHALLDGHEVEALLALVDPGDRQDLRRAWQAMRDGTADGIDVSVRVHPVVDRLRGVRLRGRAVLHDALGHAVEATGLIEAVESVAYALADGQRDPLTRLPNRDGIKRDTQQLLDQPAPQFGLIFIDLDGFRELSDSYGHEQADRLLVAFGGRLAEALGADTELARWGADEFVLLLPAGSGDTEVRAAAQQVLAALAQPFQVGDHTLGITATLGAVLAPQDGRDFGLLMRKADLAVRAGKARGRNCLVFYDESLDDNAERRVRMASLLRADTERNAFRFVAQPKVDAQGRPVGLELLMRWAVDPFGPVSPVEFIPLAEKVGLIQMMGRHAAHAAAQLAAQCAELGCALPVAVNLSPRQLQQPGLDSQLLNACRRHGIAPAMLDLELTESALVQGMDLVAPILHRLRKLGFSLALDDFGTGYSSLSYLRHLPFDKVKIDRSFVLDIDRDPAAARMLDSIVQLCNALGMRIVAEGVETREQADALARLGVHEFQGYLFARPLPTDEWLGLLRRHPGRVPALPLPPRA